MALVFKDRVKETTTTSGTGTITLAGAVSGFQTFSVIGDGNTTYYTIVSGTDWEVGIGTYTLSGTTLSRDTILESSNGGSAISLSGTSTVFCTYAAEKSVYRNSNDQINVTASGLIFSDSTVQTTAAVVSGDNVSLLNNDAGYLTTHPAVSAASDSDNSGRTYIQDLLFDSYGHVTGISTATETVVDTDTTYTAGSGLQLNGTTFDALTATTSTSGITTLTNTIDATQTKALTPKAVNDAGYITGTGNANQVAIFDTTTSVSGAQGIEIETTGDPGLDIFRKSGQTTTLVNIYTESTGILTAIDENGYIGIGTGDPTYHLQVEGTGDFDTIRFSDGSLQTTSASGAVIGPGSSTDEAIARFDGTTGKLVQDSNVTVNDVGKISTPGLICGSVGIQLGETNYMGFDSVTVTGVTNSSPQQLSFLGSNITGTQFSTYLFMVRLANITTNEENGSCFLFRKSGTASTSDWESFEVGRRETATGECPEIFIDTGEADGGAVQVRLNTDPASGTDDVLAHITAWRVDRGDNDYHSILPDMLWANKRIGNATQQVYITGSGNPNVGLGGNTNPVESLDVTDKVHLQSSYCTAVDSSDGGTMTLDFDAGNVFNVALTGNITSVTFSNADPGQKVLINVKQDSAGGYTITGGDWSATKWTDNTAPTLSTASGTVDTIGVMVPRASTYYGYTVGTGIIDV